ncbi:MFS transporter [Streptomyces sp. NPDC001793]|uniref:MFS transporter n=1 Tax=Streptomyces sp. NPDC001793 TaxID=3154657 RepID=UPI003331F29C
MFLGNVDIAIVNVATPTIQHHLHASGAELELIVSGYTLTYAVLLITSARMGGARGYRRMFQLGLAIFASRRWPAAWRQHLSHWWWPESYRAPVPRCSPRRY